MTQRELTAVLDEWELALSAAADALDASSDVLTPAVLRVHRRSLELERRETAKSLAGLAQLLHLRSSAISFA